MKCLWQSTMKLCGTVFATLKLKCTLVELNIFESDCLVVKSSLTQQQYSSIKCLPCNRSEQAGLNTNIHWPVPKFSMHIYMPDWKYMAERNTEYNSIWCHQFTCELPIWSVLLARHYSSLSYFCTSRFSCSCSPGYSSYNMKFGS